jgi:pyruvate carboxylase
MCYSGDLTNPDKSKYTLDYYLNLARQLVDEGCHVLCVKVSTGTSYTRAVSVCRLP